MEVLTPTVLAGGGGGGGISAPGGSDTQIQFNDSGSLGGDVDLTWNKTTNVMTVAGDLTLDDGVAGPVTTLQTITPTQNNTISLPNATGTVALVAGSSGQLVYNNAGVYAGIPGSTVGASGNVTLNASSGFTGNLLDLQVGGTSNLRFAAGSTGALNLRGSTEAGEIACGSQSILQFYGSSYGVQPLRVVASGGLTFGGAGDTTLTRDAADKLAQRRDNFAQTFRVYNTYTSSTNYELGKLEWSGNTFRIGTEKGSGGGTARALEFQTDGTTRLTVDTSGGLLANAASGFTGNLLDLQVNGTSRVSITGQSTPVLSGSGGLTITPAGALLGVGASNTISWYFTSNAFAAASNNSTIIFGATSDVVLARDAANTLAQRNGTNAQTFRVYGTESSSLANYVRASLSSSSTAVTLAAESAGTGAANVPINLTAKGTGTVKVNSVAEVAVSSTVAGLPTAPAVGMLTRVTDATAPAVGATVTGGGSAAALVWYNGTNWTVIGV